MREIFFYDMLEYAKDNDKKHKIMHSKVKSSRRKNTEKSGAKCYAW